MAEEDRDFTVDAGKHAIRTVYINFCFRATHFMLLINQPSPSLAHRLAASPPHFSLFQTNTETLRALLAGGSTNPALVQALQAGLAQMIGQSSGFIESLPGPIQNRIHALSEVDDEIVTLNDGLEEEIRVLIRKYEGLKKPHFDRRRNIITGVEEVEQNKTEQDGEQEEEAPKGIPDFWMIALRNHPTMMELINDKDSEVLSHLIDIREDTIDPEEDEEEMLIHGGGFRLVFHFSPDNPFFTNSFLTKEYIMSPEDDEVLHEIKGCSISWRQGKNVTVKVMKKKPKSGAKGNAARPQTKTEEVESFFRWFTDTPEMPEDLDEEEGEDPEMDLLRELVEIDMSIADAIREEILPTATAWFTGEALQEYDDEDSDDDEDDDDDEGESDDEDDDDEGGAPMLEAPKGRKAAAATAPNPEDCKQQ